ncbi:MAG: lectin-like protein, partial [Gammaproteobacteria bacterium]
VTGTAAEGGTLTADVLNATDLDGSVSISFQWQSTGIEPSELPGVKTWSENGHEYALIESIGLSWDGARSLAIGLGEGWDLVTVTSQAEHEFLVRNVLPVDALNRTHYWIGFTDAVTEGQFVWVSGEASSFNLWHPGEPNNVGEDHAAYDYRAGWGWNDAAVQTIVPSGFVVERSRWSNLSSGSSLSIPSDESLVGKTVRVVATTTDALGGTTEFTSAGQTIANVNDAPTGSPSITGTATQGQTLTANTAGIADADGLGSFSYVWKADGTAIAGATASTLVLTQAQVGKAITVEVSYTDGQGTAEGPLASAATAAVANVDDEATGTLAVTGTAAEGGTLTASLTGVSDLDGTTTTAYRWQESVGGTFTDLAGQTAATLNIPSDQSFVGKTL